MAYFIISLARWTWVAVIVGTFAIFVTELYLVLFFAEITLDPKRFEPLQWPQVVMPLGLLVFSGLGLVTKNKQKQLLSFGFGHSGSLFTLTLRWLVRSRYLTVLAIFVLHLYLSGDQNASPLVMVLFYSVLFFVTVNFAPEGIGSRANVAIRHELPNIHRRLQWHHGILAFAVATVIVSLDRFQPQVSTATAYKQLVVFSIAGSIICWLYLRVYRQAVTSSTLQKTKWMLSRSINVTAETSWGLGIIGLSFIPNAMEWTWMPTFFGVLIISLGAAMLRVTRSKAESQDCFPKGWNEIDPPPELLVPALPNNYQKISPSKFILWSLIFGTILTLLMFTFVISGFDTFSSNIG